MMFVDGESFTSKAQRFARDEAINLKQGDYHIPSVFVWLPGISALSNMFQAGYMPVQSSAIRSYYYTSYTGDDTHYISARMALKKIGFQPEVFKRAKEDEPAKGVSIALVTDLISHSFADNLDVAVVIAADGDYVSLIEEIKRIGKVVYVVFFNKYIDPKLGFAADRFFDISQTFAETWSSSKARP